MGLVGWAALKTLHLYLTWQVFVALLMTVAVFTFVLLLGNLLKEIIALLVNRQATLRVVIEAIGLLIPWVLALALPMGMLTATLLTFGRFSADQELTAARANGISLLALVWPVVLLSVALSVLCGWFNLQFSQQCRVAYKQLLVGLGRADPLSFLAEGRFTEIPGKTGATNYYIYFGKKDGFQLKDIMLSELNQTQVVKVVRAVTGALELDATNHVFTLYLTNCWGMTYAPLSPRFTAAHFLQVSNLVGQLREPTNELSRFVWDRFSAATRAALTVTNTSTNTATNTSTNTITGISTNASTNTNIEEWPRLLAEEFNRILRTERLFEERRFEGIALSEDTRTLLRETSATNQEVSQLNCQLLEDAYPRNLVKSPRDEWSPFYLDEPSIDFRIPPTTGDAPRYSDMTFTELLAEKQRLENLPFKHASPGKLSAEQLRRELRQTRGLREEFLLPVTVQMHRQVAFSFACIGFTLVGIPLGIRSHRRETSVGIGIAIALVLVYYGFIILGQSLQTRTEWAQWLMWAPNFLFQATGAVLLWRANRGI